MKPFICVCGSTYLRLALLERHIKTCFYGSVYTEYIDCPHNIDTLEIIVYIIWGLTLHKHTSDKYINKIDMLNNLESMIYRYNYGIHKIIYEMLIKDNNECYSYLEVIDMMIQNVPMTVDCALKLIDIYKTCYETK